MIALTWLGTHSAEVIALCALGFTAWQALVQRRHNRISVKPHLTTFVNQELADTTGMLEVRLSNNGLGPAFIQSFQAYLERQPCKLEAAVASLLRDYKTSAEVEKIKTTVMELTDDYAMPAGESKILLSVTFPCHSSNEMDERRKQLNRLDVVLGYSSAYGEHLTCDTRTKPAIINILAPSNNH